MPDTATVTGPSGSGPDRSGPDRSGPEGSGRAEVRVALVDDQPLVRKGLRLILESEPGLEVVCEAGDAREAVERALAHRPDVVLMDIQLPGADGLTAAARILELLPATRVLILTTFDRDDYLFAALRLGTSGFLVKTAPAEEIIAGVQAAAAGGGSLSPQLAARVIAEFARTHPAPAPAGRHDRLTPRERQVLELRATGLSNPEIAAELHVGDSTVKTYVSAVLNKLALRDRIHVVIYAYDHGLVPRRR